MTEILLCLAMQVLFLFLFLFMGLTFLNGTIRAFKLAREATPAANVINFGIQACCWLAFFYLMDPCAGIPRIVRRIASLWVQL